ncbi:hypothetical protein CS062_03550 [Roseateles chitinivorans]|uniref:Uncharacterized protein n=1 Tax=Roseateles chitinivorans TaxID=2917965 RepID=A0A2G9CE39_9BURK|nr:hypothetical protein [Roseateles chitinivorans]PIM54700.1 hypothetical protein CS062_03550 [Roseateles chitinivorans]
MKTLHLDLTHWQAHLILEALTELDAQWAYICQTSTDEDVVADYGNDLIELRTTLGEAKTKALEVFGPGVINFDRTPL